MDQSVVCGVGDVISPKRSSSRASIRFAPAANVTLANWSTYRTTVQRMLRRGVKDGQRFVTVD